MADLNLLCSITVIKDNVPDHAVIDLRLKDGSGLDVIEALEKQYPDRAQLY